MIEQAFIIKLYINGESTKNTNLSFDNDGNLVVTIGGANKKFTLING